MKIDDRLTGFVKYLMNLNKEYVYFTCYIFSITKTVTSNNDDLNLTKNWSQTSERFAAISKVFKKNLQWRLVEKMQFADMMM